MFGKKKNSVMEEEIVVEENGRILDEIIVPTKSRKQKRKDKLKAKNETQKEEHQDTVKNHFVWSDIDSNTCTIETSPNKEESSIKTTNIKKNLDDYFLRNNSDLFVNSGKKKHKKKMNAKYKNFYRYNGTKFSTPNDLLSYIDKHPKKLDKIASKMIDDELFFEWLGKHSHQFTESVKEFRQFKKNIKN